MTGNDTTAELCNFLVTTSFEDLPEDVLTHAKRMLLDTVGVTLLGADTPPASKLQSTLTLNDSDSKIVGTGNSTSLSQAARIHGVMAHALDFDDVHHRMGGHPSAPVLSALLPVAEQNRVSGKELLLAFVLGTEIELFLADVLNPGHYERGWHPTSVLGTLGAAGAVGVLLNLDKPELRQALGIAASSASGTKENFGTMTKPLHVGNAARAGLEAGILANTGFTASQEILEASFGGFFDLFEGQPEHDYDDHLEHLGDPWCLLDPPVGFKPYPSCGSTHSAIDAALAIQNTHDFDIDDIESVQIEEHPRRLGHTNKPDPETSLDGKFSVQYCVAVALNEQTVWLDHFDDENIARETYQSLLERITVSPGSDDFEDREWGARVTVTTKNQVESVTIEAPRGSSKKPLSQADLEDKYRRCARTTLESDQVERSLSCIESLESVEDITELLNDLTPI